MRITKGDLIRSVSNQTDYPYQPTKEIIDSFCEFLGDYLQRGDTIHLTNCFIISTKKSKSKVYYREDKKNPGHLKLITPEYKVAIKTTNRMKEKLSLLNQQLKESYGLPETVTKKEYEELLEKGYVSPRQVYDFSFVKVQNKEEK